MKFVAGDVLAHLTIQGLTVTIKDAYESVPGYWASYEYTLGKDYDPEDTAKSGERMYNRSELEDESKYVCLKKNYTYKYHVGQYFMTNNEQKIPCRIVALYQGEYVVQMFYPTSRPLFFTTQEVLDNNAVEVLLLPSSKGESGAV